MEEATSNTNHSLPPKPRKSRRLDRPGDLAAEHFLKIFGDRIQQPNGTFPIMIPIPPKDAKALGLKVPDCDKSQTNSTSSNASSGHSSISKPLVKKSNDSAKSRRSTCQQNVQTKLAKKHKDLKNERKANRYSTTKKLNSFHEQLERGLKNISHKTRRKLNSQGVNKNTALFVDTDSTSTTSRSTKASLTSEEDKSDRLGTRPSSKSMRQLFSMADSWSSDSVISHSESCACCHNRELCPLHGSSFFGSK